MNQIITCVMMIITIAISTNANAIDYDDCKDQVDRLRRSARDANDQTSVDDIRSALDDVDNKLRRAKMSCGYVDACTMIRATALKHGVGTVQTLCKSTENGIPVKTCMDCAAGIR